MNAATPVLADALATERRQVTVVFCDLVESSQLAAQLDPEDYRDVLRAYQACCVEVVQAHGGLLGQYLGDGVVAYFGYPQASEDAPEQAVRAAAAALRGVEALKTAGGRLRARAGLATGLAVIGDIIGDGISRQTAVTGQVAILASRIQEMAAPGVVTISDATRQLVGNVFECTSLGSRALKGLPGEVKVWAVDREARNESRFAAARRSRISRIVGRRRQLHRLQAMWRDAARGRGGVQLITGEAGIGKSTLLRFFRKEAEVADERVVMLQCSPRHLESPLRPAITYFQRAMDLNDGDDTDARLAKVRAFLVPLGMEEALPALARLLSIGPATSAPAAPGAAEQAKRETIALLVQLLARAAASAPVLLVLEDAHWADPTTNEFITALLQADRKRMLFLATTRPENPSAWMQDRHVATLNLPRLSMSESMRLVRRLAGRRLPGTVLAGILQRSDGVPLYLEEIALATLAADPGDKRAAHAIPMTLQDGLAARLDRLGSARQTAQVASVLGRSFALDPLLRMLERPDDAVSSDLLALQASSVIHQTGRDDGREFIFSHALLQEAAYDSMLMKTRKQLHERAAAALEELRPQLAVLEPETLAHHHEAAGNGAAAARYWLKAGQRAQANAANVEAVTHLRRGLRTLNDVEPPAQRDELEFRLQLALGQASYVLLGPGHADAAAAYTRAQALVETVAPEQRSIVLYGIFAGYHFASKFDLADEPARRMLALATRDDRRGDICQAHRMLGYIAFFRGHHAAARSHFAQLWELYRIEDHGPKAYQFGADCRVGCEGFHAVIDSVSLPYAAATARADENIEYARSLDHPASLGWAFAAASYVRYFGDDPRGALEISERGMNYCEANNVASWYAHCRLFYIWSKARLESPRGRDKEMRELMALAARGNLLGLCLFRIALVEILLLDGQTKAAVSEAGQAIDDIRLSGQLFFESHALLMHATALTADGQPTPVIEKALRETVDRANDAGASVMELRACEKLASLVGADAGVASRRTELRALLNSDPAAH